MAVDLTKLVAVLDTELRTADIPDYSGAVNGLQVSNSGRVQRVAAAVDASLPVLKKARELGADLLLVHHGLFWQASHPWTGVTYDKMQVCVAGDLAVYSSHLPLDVHAQWGNNAGLLRALGLPPGQPFLEYKGFAVGQLVQLDAAMDRSAFVRAVKQAVGSETVYCSASGPAEVRRVGICTGGAGGEILQAVRAGVDTFLTGEGPHWSHGLAEEHGINLVYAGHYATETFGVKALAAWVAEQYDLPWSFIDHPSGL